MVGENAFRYLGNRSVKVLRNAVSTIDYEHFHWFAVWNVTWACNLNCVYCNARPSSGHFTVDPDGVRKALATLKRIDPRCITLFGGEPTIASGLAPALHEIRAQRPHCFIQLNSNGVREKEICDMIPLLDTAVVSLDTVGDSHPLIPRHRPSSLLPKIELYAEKCRESGVALMVNVVVSKHNVKELPALADWVVGAMPDVGVNFRPLMPKTDARSVLHDPRTESEFRNIIENLPRRFLHEVHTERLLYQGKSTCYKQFFCTNIDEDGTVATCKKDYHLRTLECWVQSNGSGATAIPALLKRFLSRVDGLLLRPGSPACWVSCDWVEHFDLFLRGLVPATDPHLFFLHGRLDNEDLEVLVDFARRHLKREISREDMKPFVASEQAIGFGKKS